MTEELMNDLFGDEEEILTKLNSVVGAQIVETVSAGGGRGVVALTDLPAGFLVLAEIPVLVWKDSDLESSANLLAALEQVFTNAKAIEVSKYLHPRVISDADNDDFQQAYELLGDEKLEQLASSYGVSIEEVTRVLLTIQHNGFVSGYYKNLCMINHSCDPNSIKYSPKSGSKGASEVWTTRPVKKGEQITICYCSPQELPIEVMQRFLLTHHRFTCTCHRCQDYCTHKKSENPVVPTELPKEVEWLHNLEKLHETLNNMEAEIVWRSFDSNRRENMKAMSAILIAVDSIVMHYTVKDSLVDRYVGIDKLDSQSWARIYKLGCSAASTCIELIDATGSTTLKMKEKYVVNEDSSENSGDGTVPTLLSFAIEAFVNYSVRLLTRQMQYLSVEHSDLANTYNDIADAFELLITRHSEKMSSMSTILELPAVSCISKKTISLAIRDQRKLRDRLKAMYSIHSQSPHAQRELREAGASYWGEINSTN